MDDPRAGFDRLSVAPSPSMEAPFPTITGTIDGKPATLTLKETRAVVRHGDHRESLRLEALDAFHLWPERRSGLITLGVLCFGFGVVWLRESDLIAVGVAAQLLGMGLAAFGFVRPRRRLEIKGEGVALSLLLDEASLEPARQAAAALQARFDALPVHVTLVDNVARQASVLFASRSKLASALEREAEGRLDEAVLRRAIRAQRRVAAWVLTWTLLLPLSISAPILAAALLDGPVDFSEALTRVGSVLVLYGLLTGFSLMAQDRLLPRARRWLEAEEG